MFKIIVNVYYRTPSSKHLRLGLRISNRPLCVCVSSPYAHWATDVNPVLFFHLGLGVRASRTFKMMSFRPSLLFVHQSLSFSLIHST